MTRAVAVQEAPTLEETRARLHRKLKGIVPDVEIELKAELAFKINRLKAEKNAVILGHNYMEPALYHSVPDHVGDSLALARESAETDADIIVFCGVQFMAETAKILNPERTVLIPSEKAGCSLASGINAANVRDLKQMYPGAPVVTYVNTYASVKAESDYCCTSGNAPGVVRHLLSEGHEQIIFLPDEYLGRNTARELGIGFVLPPLIEGITPEEVRGPAIIGWRARCEVHEIFSVEDVQAIHKQFPDVSIVAHPECHPDVVDASDYSGSTKQMNDYVSETDAPRFLLLTECSMGDNIMAENPEKEMLRLCSSRCPHMNQITMEDTLLALEDLRYQVELPRDIIDQARLPIDRMLAIN